MFRKNNVLLLFALIACLNTTAIAQKLSPNTEAFLLRPSTPVTRTLFSEDSSEFIKSYIQINDVKAINKIQDLGGQVYISTSNLLTASLPKDKLREIAELEEVDYIQMASNVKLCMDNARAKGNINQIHNGTDLSKSYNGTGVVVGIIDQGFQFAHVNFYDKDKERYRIKRVWNQNKNGKSPEGFGYGTEYTTETEILRAQTDVQTTSHGTHVTGIAAGGDLTTDYYGIAIDADLVFVSYGQNDVDIANAIKYIYDYAESVGKPCVINMSIGSHVGPHDGTSMTDRLADEMQGAGKLLVGAAGNEGEDKVHLNYTFTPENNTVKTMLAYDNPDRKIGIADIWGTKGNNFSVQGCIVSTLTGEVVETTDVVSTSKAFSKRFTFSNGTALNGYITLASSIDMNNERPNVYFETVMSALPANRTVGIIITAENGEINMWQANGGYFTNNSKMGWQSGNTTSTCGEIGGSGKRIISVGAYITKSSFTNLDGEKFTYPSATPMDGIAGFSSKGPTSDGRMKPDITAPGMVLSSSVSSLSSEFDKKELTAKSIRNMKTYYYGMMQGTSMAAPFVTGTLALWLEANPKLTPEGIRTIFKKTAINDNYTGEVRETGSNTWGYGKIDGYNGLVEAISLVSSIDTTEKTQSGVQVTIGNDNQDISLLFPEEDASMHIQVYNLSGAIVSEQSLEGVVTGQKISLPTSTWERGVYVLRIVGKKYNESIKVVIG